MNTRRALLTFLTAVFALFFAGFSAPAHASSLPSLLFNGGTANEQKQVTEALEASSFDWSLIRQQITVNIGDYGTDDSTVGNVYLDSSLLDSGTFAWGTVQHEFGHQVDFFLLNDTERAQLDTALGGTVWFPGEGSTSVVEGATEQYGCERFASELAWAYWQSPENAMSPRSLGVESSGMPTAQFQALLAQLLGDPSLATAAAPTATNVPATLLTTVTATATKTSAPSGSRQKVVARSIDHHASSRI